MYPVTQLEEDMQVEIKAFLEGKSDANIQDELVRKHWGSLIQSVVDLENPSEVS